MSMSTSLHKPALKSLSNLYQPQLSEEQAENEVSFHIRSQKVSLSESDQSQLFAKVLKFLKEFMGNRNLQVLIAEHLNKREAKRESNSKLNEKIMSFKKMNMGSRVCFEGEVVRKDVPVARKGEEQIIRGNNKKISIFVMEEDYSSSQEFFSDEIVSQSVVKTIRSIQIPHMEMNLKTISMIYETPQPFLINLSLCLFIRYCLVTRKKVNFEESAWVLTVATIIAYKLYYDEQIEGLIQCFMGVMKIGRKDLIDLQRCFLEEIDYNTMIRNYDYHYVLSTLLSMVLE